MHWSKASGIVLMQTESAFINKVSKKLFSVSTSNLLFTCWKHPNRPQLGGVNIFSRYGTLKPVRMIYVSPVHATDSKKNPEEFKDDSLLEAIEGYEEEIKKISSERTLSSRGKSSDTNAEHKHDNSYLSDLIVKEENLELFREIANGDPAVYNELRSLQMKLDIAAVQFKVAPKLTKEDWIEFLNTGSNRRKSYVAYIISTAVKDSKKIKKGSQVPDYIDFRDDTSNDKEYNDPRCYHLFHNSMFLRFSETTLTKMAYARAISSILHSSEIYIDCSYESYMTQYEIKYLAKQIAAGIGYNLRSPEPFHIIFCNFNENNNLSKFINKYSHSFHKDDFPVTITEKSYLDLTPKDKLVYLTPHCKTFLKTVDPEKKYIIGGFVDKTNTQPISLAKAKEHDLAMAKLPLDKYLDWGHGKKSLAVNHVIQILVDYRNHNDWPQAFKSIPKRFLIKQHEPEPKKFKSNIREKVNVIFGYCNNPKNT